MSKLAVQIENVSKLYRLGERRRYKTAREAMMNLVNAPARWVAHKWNGGNGKPETMLWALREVSFEVEEGEVIGIIGRNGAGKSTLLKILARITDPTDGQITIQGRVGSLLEVGTGFHPELTGRENIFLNGTILGMRRMEILQKFDEIVAFAETEQFIDTPVKHYSSGMYTRLAFAVAAHLQPEILIVDEVLAVGDVEFQKKCLGKMSEVAREGRTVLFVSHNMGAVMQLCRRAVILDRGKVRTIGRVQDVVSEYLSVHTSHSGEVSLREFSGRRGSGSVRFESVRILNTEGIPTTEFSIGDDIQVEFVLRRLQPTGKLTLAVELSTADGLNLANMIDVDSGQNAAAFSESLVSRVRLRDIRLYPGAYRISLYAGSIGGRDTHDHVHDCLQFDIVGGGKLTARTLPRDAGILFLTPDWEFQAD